MSLSLFVKVVVVVVVYRVVVVVSNVVAVHIAAAAAVVVHSCEKVVPNADLTLMIMYQFLF